MLPVQEIRVLEAQLPHRLHRDQGLDSLRIQQAGYSARDWVVVHVSGTRRIEEETQLAERGAPHHESAEILREVCVAGQQRPVLRPESVRILPHLRSNLKLTRQQEVWRKRGVVVDAIALVIPCKLLLQIQPDALYSLSLGEPLIRGMRLIAIDVRSRNEPELRLKSSAVVLIDAVQIERVSSPLNLEIAWPDPRSSWSLSKSEEAPYSSSLPSVRSPTR